MIRSRNLPDLASGTVVGMFPKFTAEGSNLILSLGDARLRSAAWGNPAAVRWDATPVKSFLWVLTVRRKFDGPVDPDVFPFAVTSIDFYPDSPDHTFTVVAHEWNGYAWVQFETLRGNDLVAYLNRGLEATVGGGSDSSTQARGSHLSEAHDLIGSLRAIENQSGQWLESWLVEYVSGFGNELPGLQAQALQLGQSSSVRSGSGLATIDSTTNGDPRSVLSRDLDKLLRVDQSVQALLNRCLEVQRLLGTPIVSLKAGLSRQLSLDHSRTLLESARQFGSQAASLLVQIGNTRQILHEAAMRLDSDEQNRLRRAASLADQEWRDHSESRAVMRDEFAQRFGVLVVVFGATGSILNSISESGSDWTKDWSWTGIRFGLTGVLMWVINQFFELISVERPESRYLLRHNRFMDRLDRGFLGVGLIVLAAVVGVRFW